MRATGVSGPISSGATSLPVVTTINPDSIPCFIRLVINCACNVQDLRLECPPLPILWLVSRFDLSDFHAAFSPGGLVVPPLWKKFRLFFGVKDNGRTISL